MDVSDPRYPQYIRQVQAAQDAFTQSPPGQPKRIAYRRLIFTACRCFGTAFARRETRAAWQLVVGVSSGLQGLQAFEVQS